MKQELPAEIHNQMLLWREGFAPMPSSYIKFHAKLAQKELKRLKNEYGIALHGKPELVGDGWMDGMRVVQAVIETQTGDLLKLKWHDSSQRFMETPKGRGSWRLSEKKLGTPIYSAPTVPIL